MIMKKKDRNLIIVLVVIILLFWFGVPYLFHNRYLNVDTDKIQLLLCEIHPGCYLSDGIISGLNAKTCICEPKPKGI